MNRLSTCIFLSSTFFIFPIMSSDDRVRITPMMHAFLTTETQEKIQQSQNEKYNQQQMEYVAYKLEQQFAEKILKIYCATLWELSSRAESYFLVRKFADTFIGSDTISLSKKLHNFIEKEIVTVTKLDIVPIVRVKHNIFKFDTAYVADTIWPVTILMSRINTRTAAYSASFLFNDDYKFIYMVTPQKKQLCFLLKKKNTPLIEPHV